jgi:hypothetical protein
MTFDAGAAASECCTPRDGQLAYDKAARPLLQAALQLRTPRPGAKLSSSLFDSHRLYTSQPFCTISWAVKLPHAVDFCCNARLFATA